MSNHALSTTDIENESDIEQAIESPIPRPQEDQQWSITRVSIPGSLCDLLAYCAVCKTPALVANPEEGTAFILRHMVGHEEPSDPSGSL